MIHTLAADTGIHDWLNTVAASGGLLAAAFALYQTHRSNQAAKEANEISRGANSLAASANQVAEKALQMQEDEGKVRLLVKPRIMCVVARGHDVRPRPLVEVINLSSFPVTVKQLWWKTNSTDDTGLLWMNPTLSAPHETLPARLLPRDAFTAIGVPEAFKNLETWQSVTACVAVTVCDESVEGMTDAWKTTLAKLVAEADAQRPAAHEPPSATSPA